MGLCKYFEDNYEMYLDRMEELNYKNDIQISTAVTFNIAPAVRTVNPKSQLLHINQKIKCKECGEFFEFSFGEQKFYTKHNLHNPKRCKKCREFRKTQAS